MEGPRRILVVGPGAIGVTVAVRLAARQRDVTAAARDAAAVAALPRVWTCVGADGRPATAEIPAVHAPSGVESSFDAVVLATKCQDALPALETWLPTLRPGGVVVAMQNGLLGDELGPLAGDRLVECTVAFPASLRAPGHSEQTGPGGLIIGPWPDARMEPATPTDQAGAFLREVAPTRVHRNMRGVKWSKLLVNSAITGLGVVTGQPLGQMLDDRRARDAFIHIVSEGHAAGVAEGVRFEKVGAFHPRMALVRRPDRLRLARVHAILRILGRRYRRHESSSLQSVRRGRPSEVPFLNGRIVEAAQRHGLEAPVNQAVVGAVADIEAGRSTPADRLLDDLPLAFR